MYIRFCAKPCYLIVSRLQPGDDCNLVTTAPTGATSSQRTIVPIPLAEEVDTQAVFDDWIMKKDSIHSFVDGMDPSDKVIIRQFIIFTRAIPEILHSNLTNLYLRDQQSSLTEMVCCTQNY